MKNQLTKLKAGLLLACVVGGIVTIFAIGWWVGHPKEKEETSAGSAQSSEKWTCSMHPQIMQPDPGSCPICGMDLIPATGKAGGSDTSTVVSKRQAEAMGLRVAPVRRQLATHNVDLVGKVVPDERYTNTITARVGGRIERLFVDYTGITVKQGDHLVKVYSPDLLVAQKELIEAKKRLNSGGNVSAVIVENRKRLYEAAKERLRLLELTPIQIEAIENAASPTDQLTVFAPEGGVVTKKHVNKGDYVKTGSALYTVSDLNTVWVTMEAYEQDLPWLHYAQSVSFTTPAVPGKTFTGRIAFIDPVLDPRTRTSRVRVNVANKDLLLKPGMFARATVAAQVNNVGQVVIPGLKDKWISPMHPEIIKEHAGDCDICGMPLVKVKSLGATASDDATSQSLVVPHSAVLQTGKQAIVYKRTTDGDELVFEAMTVTLGHRVNDYYIVQDGLAEGDFVVTQGAFKLDSELQINAKKSMMSMPASYVGPALPSSPLDTQELRKLQHALHLYLEVTDAMAYDKPDDAVTKLPKLSAALKATAHAPLVEEAKAVELSKQASDIKGWLDRVSLQLASVVKDRAADQLEPLYLLHCPMARDGKGGHWLGKSHKIENPYFGSEMFGCGSVKSQLTVKAHEMKKSQNQAPMKSPSKSGHEHHNH